MSVEPARWQSTSTSGLAPWSRPRVTPRVGGMAQRRPGPPRTAAAPAARPSCTSLDGRARDEVGDDVIDRDPPARRWRSRSARWRRTRTPSRAPARPRPAPASRTSSRSRSRDPTVCTTVASGRSGGGTLSPGGDARRSRSSTPAAAAAADSSGSSDSTVCSPASKLIPASIASSSATRHSSVSAPPNGATPITSTFAPSCARLGHGRARSAPAGARRARPASAVVPADVESTTQIDVALAVAQDPVRGLGVRDRRTGRR